MVASPSEEPASQQAKGAASSPQFNFDPDFAPLGQQQRRDLILRYAWQHHRIQIIIMGIVMLALFVGVFFWDELCLPIFFRNATTASPANPTNWANWLINAQSFLSVGTLLVALSVWWGEISEDWQNDLPKRLSVFFFYKDRPLIVCRYVWLAGADEIRTWGQQVALQAQPIKPDKPPDKFDFGPDVETRKPILLLGPRGEVWKHYSVCFRLTKLNPTLTNYTTDEKTSGKCRYQNLAANDTDVDDVGQEYVDTIPEVAQWKVVVQQKLSRKMASGTLHDQKR